MLRYKERYNSFLRWVVTSRIYEDRLGDLANRLAVSLNMLAGLIAIVYMVVDLLIGAYTLIIPHSFLLIGFFVGIYFFRTDRIELAKTIVLSLYNIAIYIAVQAEPYGTASSLYFLTVMIGAIVVFEYTHIRRSILFIIISYSLYMASRLTEFNVIPPLEYTDTTITSFFIINVTVFTISISLVLILYIQMIYIQNRRIRMQNEKLRQTNRELDYFLYSTSHDLRAPLATLLGLINIAQTSSCTEEIKSYHEMMRSRIDKMDSFIRDIIDIIRNSRMPVTIEPVNINKLVDGIIQELDNPMGFNHVCWENRLPESLEILTDKKRLATVLKNLLSNALKYSDRGKSKPFVEISGKPNYDSYFLSVKDNGIGIDERHMEKIFQMFYRATENSKGAGLGLYIAGETTKTLGGEISVTSERGKGADFQLSLPMNN